MEGRWASSSFWKFCCVSIPLVLLLLMHLFILITYIFFLISSSPFTFLYVYYIIYIALHNESWSLHVTTFIVYIYIYFYYFVLKILIGVAQSSICVYICTYISFLFKRIDDMLILCSWVMLYYFVHIFVSINGLFHNIIGCHLDFYV